MAQTKIDESAALPLEDVAAGVRGLRIGFVNVFGVENADGTWVLIDAGIPFSATLIKNWGERNFGGAPEAIVLTHGHFDHVSAAGDLAESWDVPIYAHALESPYLTGEQEYPPPDPGAGGGLMSALSPMYPRGPVNLSKRLVPLARGADGKQLVELPSWEILHTPGHTPGHISLYRSADMTLIVGDAFCTTKPESFFTSTVTQPPELHGPPAYFTMDPVQAARSIRRLMRLAPRTVAPGHGRPLAGRDLAEKLSVFAAEFLSENEGGDIHEAA